MLKAQLVGLLTSLEQSQQENKRQWDSLQSALTEVARREEDTATTLSQIRLGLLKRHGTGEANACIEHLIRELRADFAGENRAHNELVLMITDRLSANDKLSERLAHLEKDIDGDLAASLKKVTDALNKEKPFFLQVAPTLLGAILGAALALLSGWLLARRTQALSNEQKRQDVTIKIIETYLSETIQGKFAKALGLLQSGWSSLSTPEERNKILEVVGFFKYVRALQERNRLDEGLFALSDIRQAAEEFFKSVHAVAVAAKDETEWNRVRKQVPSQWIAV